LVFSTLSYWLTEEDVSRAAIGFFSWVGLMYSIKVFWAPVIDRISLPVLSQLLGQRRGWLVASQIALAVCILGLAVSDPSENLRQVAILCVLLAFSSATQDVVIDAFRIESAANELQGVLAAMYQGGYRLGMIAASIGALYVAHFYSWNLAYSFMAVLMGVGLLTTLVISEPKRPVDKATQDRETELSGLVTGTVRVKGTPAKAINWFSGAVVGPFTDYFARAGLLGLLVLAFVGAYRLSDITMGIMSGPFYLDLGFDKLQIANITKGFGIIMTMIGAFAGGLVIVRFGLMGPLFFGALLAIPTNLIFAWLATQGPNVEYLVYTISADNFAGGFAGTCLIAYMSSLVNKAYTATQYALFSSFFTLPGKFLGGFSGVVVEATSYETFFTYAAFLGLPAVIMCLVIMRYGDRLKPAGPEVEPEPDTQTGEGGKAPAGA
jgi:PAT family beta-lactamase induction signal transducer AmpG